MKRIAYSKVAVKKIQQLDRVMKKRVQTKIEAVARGEIEGIYLQKPLQNHLKIRIDPLRIVYRKEKTNTIFVVNIEHRSKVYK